MATKRRAVPITQAYREARSSIEERKDAISFLTRMGVLNESGGLTDQGREAAYRLLAEGKDGHSNC